MARILIVDDSLIMRKNLESILKGGGHTVVAQAANGKQAVSLYKDLKPDLVTMDISMPMMTGTDALAEILKEDPQARIVMVSAINQKQMVFEAIKAGAKHYIVKPISSENVLKTVEAVLKTSNFCTQ